ncbi:MAG: sigma-54-dependent Fis family transcriptional regulator, partial [Spirochaetes bacterium]|nr:sigma-54-dependent Fis family transcriptional regulator [Spirochaetota bacterium]
MENNKRVLVVDDDISSCDIIAEFLKKRGFKPLTASNGIMALEQMKQTPVDAVLTDLRMPDMDGISFYNQILENDMSEIPVIFMTAYGTIPEIVSIMKKGAIDTLAKPINYENLEIILNRVIKYKRMAEELEKLKEEKNTQNFSELIGKSKKMQKIFNLIKTVSGTDVTVLIEGESGTGKDLVASAIHKNSIRKNGEFIAINCSAIPRDL